MATVLLIRSVEEHDPAFFSPDALSGAALAAAGTQDDLELIERRSAYLYLRLPPAIQAWAHTGLPLDASLMVVVVATFLLGASSNFLGPPGLVHVVYNPLAFLLIWNIAVYLIISARAVKVIHRAHSKPSATPIFTRSGLVQLLIRDLWSAWSRWANRLPSGTLRSADQVASDFRQRYWEAAGPIVLARIAFLMHVGAICLLLGAVSGTYVRGLFLEYNAVWRSTFLDDPDAVARLLNVLYAPGLLLSDGALLGSDSIQSLFSSTGASAAPWIHRIALTALVIVVLPRLLLMFLAGRIARREARQLRVDLTADAYYVRQLRSARDKHVHELRQEIASGIRLAVGQLAESIALFVRRRFYDRNVAPVLLHFRNTGGRIKDVEAQIKAAQEAFQGELLTFLQTAKSDFENSVRLTIQRLVGKELTHTARLQTHVSDGSLAFDKNLPGSVAETLGDGLGVTAVVTVSAVVASLSGGIGKSLGIALVSSLFGTSGPVGLVIGGVLALIIAGIGYQLGRERVADVIKARDLPATIVAFVLSESKIERAGEEIYEKTKEEVLARLEPQITSATETLFSDLVSAVAISGSRVAAR